MYKSNLKIGDKLVYSPKNETYTITEIDRKYNIIAMGIHYCDYRTVQEKYQYLNSDGKLINLINK